MRNTGLKPGPGIIHPIMAGVAFSQIEALKKKRTYYVSPHRCNNCDTPFRWAHSSACMACNPKDGEGIGLKNV